MIITAALSQQLAKTLWLIISNNKNNVFIFSPALFHCLLTRLLLCFLIYGPRRLGTWTVMAGKFLTRIVMAMTYWQSVAGPFFTHTSLLPGFITFVHHLAV